MDFIRNAKLALTGGNQNRRNFFDAVSPGVDRHDQGQPWLSNLREQELEKHEQMLEDQSADEYQWMVENGLIDD